MTEPNQPPTPPSTPPPTPPTGADSSNRTVMLVLAYLGPLALIPLLTEKEDGEVQWHAKHGLVLFGISFLASVVLSGASSIVPFLGCVALPVLMLAGFGLFVVDIVCMIKAIGGERFLVPGISSLVDKF